MRAFTWPTSIMVLVPDPAKPAILAERPLPPAPDGGPRAGMGARAYAHQSKR